MELRPKARGETKFSDGVRHAIDLRLGAVSGPCRAVLGEAAVLGEEFDLEVLERIERHSRTGLRAALDEALTAGLITRVPEAPGRLRFYHDLVREVLYGELVPLRRASAHHRAAKALEAIFVEDREAHLAELAHHFTAGADVGGLDEAVEYSKRAAEQAMARLAFEEAVRLFETVLRVLDRQEPQDGDRLRAVRRGLAEARATADGDLHVPSNDRRSRR